MVDMQQNSTKPNHIYLIWHSITYNGWYAIKPKQTKQGSWGFLYGLDGHAQTSL